MIERLQISGFKALGVKGVDIPFAPITLLLGENSVGKSSVFQALLALQQSWRTFGGIGLLNPVGSEINLGRFSSVQHRMGEFVTAEVVIGIESESGPLEATWSVPAQRVISESREAVAEPPAGWPDCWRDDGLADCGTLSSLRVGRFLFSAEVEQRTSRLVLTLNHECVLGWLEEVEDPVLVEAVQSGGFLYWVLDPTDESRFEPSVGHVDQQWLSLDEQGIQRAAIENLRQAVADDPASARLWSQASHAIRSLGGLRRKIRHLCHIGGIRERGRRLYEVVTNDDPWNIGSTGERIADLLTHHPQALERTNHLLELLGIEYRISIDDPNTLAQVREIYLEDTRLGPGAGNLVNLPDVGTGISQLLPLAVQTAVFMDRQTFDTEPLIMVEQPELHLHPRLQARLAKMLAGTITLEVERGGSGTTGRPVQFLIETHSEHLVRALGVLIERRQLSPEAVALVQMGREADGEVYARRVRFTKDGRFRDVWPEGFFPEREQLLDGALL